MTRVALVNPLVEGGWWGMVDVPGWPRGVVRYALTRFVTSTDPAVVAAPDTELETFSVGYRLVPNPFEPNTNLWLGCVSGAKPLLRLLDVAYTSARTNPQWAQALVERKAFEAALGSR